MSNKVTYTLVTLVAAVVLLVAVSIDGWGCGGSILCDKCKSEDKDKVTGPLLLCAGVCLLIALIFFIVLLASENGWSSIVATTFIVLATVLAGAGVLYYLNQSNTWSVYLSTVATTITVILAVFLISDLHTGDI